jgi:glycosyltransferase involved in cell wall biosynthesis
VIDSKSDDATVELSKSCGARVVEHEWAGFGPQKNIGLEQAQGEWALFIDADEEVTPELSEEINATLQSPKVDFYWLRIVTVFLGHPLRHMYGHNPRLFKKSAGRWTDAKVHEQAETLDGVQIRLGDDKSKVLKQPLLHHSHPTIASYLKKMHHYTTLDAEQMMLTGRLRSGKAIPAEGMLSWHLAIRQFIKLLFYRGGWLDGWAGWVWCYMSGYYEYEMAQKYLMLVKQKIK